MQITDTLDALKTKRSSWLDFAARYSDHVAELGANKGLFDTEISKLIGDKKTAYDALHGAVAQSRTRLEAVATLEADGWVMKSGQPKASFAMAQAEYKKANQTLENFFLGTHEHELEVAGVKVKATASPELSGAFKEFRTSVEKTKSMMGNPFGMARVNGWSKIGDTVEHNLKGMKFWEEGYKLTAKTAPAVVFRAGALVAAGGAITDSIIRGRTNDGEDRSFVSRVMEAAGGAGLASAALLAGRAL